ncbi:MAG TPA: hypothetical protein VFQ09_08820 [Rubrobacter sp.]|nr:hypothetical protein [Rubrobacter sp.]
MSDPLAQALALKDALAAQDDTKTMLPLLDPLLEALRVREGLLPWIVYQDPADRPGFREAFEAGFNAFWAVYPVKVGKLKARQAAYRAARRRDFPGWDRCISAVEAQKRTPRWQGGTIPNPETWFNGGRWEDDVSTMSAIGGNGNGHYQRAEDLPPRGYLYTEGERSGWPRLDKWERKMLLENIGHEMPRRRRLQEAGEEEYWTP